MGRGEAPNCGPGVCEHALALSTYLRDPQEAVRTRRRNRAAATGAHAKLVRTGHVAHPSALQCLLAVPEQMEGP